MKRFLYELSESWKIAASQMRSNLTRSTLTALGVIIGSLPSLNGHRDWWHPGRLRQKHVDLPAMTFSMLGIGRGEKSMTGELARFAENKNGITQTALNRH